MSSSDAPPTSVSTPASQSLSVSTTTPSQPTSISTDSQSSSTSPPTTTTPQTPTTTPQTTPTQPTTTPTDGGTTPSVQSPTTDSGSESATATPLGSASATSTPSVRTITSSSSFTSQVPTTIASTDAAGSVVFVTSTVPEVFTTSITTTTGGGGGSSNHNSGIIIGAVVGGVTGIILLLVLIFCIRRRSHKDDFDGNFDPDRVLGHSDVVNGTLPNVDLAEEVTPFPQSQPQAYPDYRPSMRQHGKSPYVAVPTSGNEYYPTEPGVGTQSRKYMQQGGAASGAPPAGAFIPPVNMYGAGPVDWHNPRPEVSPPPSTASVYTSSTRATKEREALTRIAEGSGLVSPQEVAEGSGEVVVHQDAGRAPASEHSPPSEIPPAYESIQRD